MTHTKKTPCVSTSIKLNIFLILRNKILSVYDVVASVLMIRPKDLMVPAMENMVQCLTLEINLR